MKMWTAYMRDDLEGHGDFACVQEKIKGQRILFV